MKTNKNQKEKHPENFTYANPEDDFSNSDEKSPLVKRQLEKKARYELGLLEKKGLNAKDLTYYVYRNYAAFNLAGMDEDVRSNFILNLFSLMEKICQNYNPKTSQLYGYLQCCVKRRRQSENKKLAKLTAQESMILFDSGTMLNLPYENDRYRSFYAPKDEEAFSIPTQIDEKTIQHLPVLALKSSWYLTDDIIDKLCKICNLNKENFIKIVEILNSKIEKRITYIENCSQKLVAMYSRQVCSQYELQKMDNYDSQYKRQLQKKQQNRYRKWKNYDFYKSKIRISTPIQLIADVLNRPITEIRNDLRYFKRNQSKFFQN